MTGPDHKNKDGENHEGTAEQSPGNVPARRIQQEKKGFVRKMSDVFKNKTKPLWLDAHNAKEWVKKTNKNSTSGPIETGAKWTWKHIDKLAIFGAGMVMTGGSPLLAGLATYAYSKMTKPSDGHDDAHAAGH